MRAIRKSRNVPNRDILIFQLLDKLKLSIRAYFGFGADVKKVIVDNFFNTAVTALYV